MNPKPASALDRAIYMEAIVEGDVEFPTACPEWCEESSRLAHRLPDGAPDLGRDHTCTIGAFIDMRARECQTSPGSLSPLEITLLGSEDRPVTVDELRQLAADALRAASWLEGRQ